VSVLAIEMALELASKTIWHPAIEYGTLAEGGIASTCVRSPNKATSTSCSMGAAVSTLRCQTTSGIVEKHVESGADKVTVRFAALLV
jgi:hypothetical protein